MTPPAAAAAMASTVAAAAGTAPIMAKTVGRNTSLQGHMFARVQHGIGNLVAQSSATAATATKASTLPPTTITRLTNISHQAPFRWIPLRSSKVAQAGSAIVYSSNYGGGLLPGDVYETSVHVQAYGARLALLTQGSNRVYKQLPRDPVNNDKNAPPLTSSHRPSRVQAQYTVDAQSLLVVAPDPLTPFCDSVLHQEQSIVLTDPSANLCFIDWVAAGRLSQGERWQQASLTSRTKLYFGNESSGTDQRPFLVDAVHLNDRMNVPNLMDWSQSASTSLLEEPQLQFNAYATLILYGNQVKEVMKACQGLQTILTSTLTSTRLSDQNNSNNADLGGGKTAPTPPEWRDLPSRLTGPVLMGITCIPPQKSSTPTTQEKQQQQRQGDVMVVRLAAVSNEDLYRVFHTCLAPLTPSFGHAFYQDRIRAVRSAAVPLVWKNSLVIPPNTTTASQDVLDDTRATAKAAQQTESSVAATSPKVQWAAHLLTDSALPTGGFAHSAGLEAAAQLQLVQTPADIERFVRATVASTLQLASPTVVQVHRAVHENRVGVDWQDIHDNLHAMMIANGPACRASLDQGASLLRLAKQWPNDTSSSSSLLDISVTQGHYAAVFSLVTATWGMSVEETRYLLAFCVARDVVSAAVRLNLLGPLASVPMLARLHQAVVTHDPSIAASSCAPVLEAVQPLHDILAVRLFRT